MVRKDKYGIHVLDMRDNQIETIGEKFRTRVDATEYIDQHLKGRTGNLRNPKIFRL